MSWSLEVLLSFIGAASAAVLFTVPRRVLFVCGFLGTVAWFSLLFFSSMGCAPVAANFLAATLVSLGAEACARQFHMPVPCFAAPAIIPLVPGLSAYRAMYAVVNGHYGHGEDLALLTLLIAAAISAGVVLAGSLYHAGRRHRAYRDPRWWVPGHGSDES